MQNANPQIHALNKNIIRIACMLIIALSLMEFLLLIFKGSASIPAKVIAQTEPAEFAMGLNVYFKKHLSGVTYSIPFDVWFPKAPQTFELCVPNHGDCIGKEPGATCTPFDITIDGGLNFDPKNQPKWRNPLSAKSILLQKSERRSTLMKEVIKTKLTSQSRQEFFQAGHPWPEITMSVEQLSPYLLECDKWQDNQEPFCKLEFSLDDDRNVAFTYFFAGESCHVSNLVHDVKAFMLEATIDVRPLVPHSSE